jgi:PTS system ascorbate-specific IIB component
MKSLRVLTVCGMGIGSSLILKMNAEKALKQLGVAADVDQAEIGLARSAAGKYDIVLTTAELADLLKDVKPPVICIKNFISVPSMVESLRVPLTELGYLES